MEARFAIEQLFKVIVRLLLNNRTVKLTPLGSLRLTAHTNYGVATEAEVTAAQISKLVIRFAMSKELKEALAKADFVFVDKLSKHPE
jgi:nucleoid DNA-binding protein